MWGFIPLQPTTPARALTKQPFIGTYIRVDYMHKVITSPVGKEYLSVHKREAFYSVWAAWFFCNYIIAMFVIMLTSCLHPRQLDRCWAKGVACLSLLGLNPITSWLLLMSSINLASLMNCWCWSVWFSLACCCVHSSCSDSLSCFSSARRSRIWGRSNTNKLQYLEPLTPPYMSTHECYNDRVGIKHVTL